MPNTVHGFFYPSPTAVPDVPSDMQALAESIETYIADEFPSVSLFPSAVIATVSGSSSIITWDSELWDTAGMHNSSFLSRITAPVDGLYEVHATLAWGSNATGYRSIEVLRNGTPVLRTRVQALATAVAVSAPTSGLVQMTAGQYLEVQQLQNSGSPLDIQPGSVFSRFQVRRVGDLV